MRDTYFVFPIHSGTVVTGLTAEIDGHFIEAKVMERRGCNNTAGEDMRLCQA